MKSIIVYKKDKGICSFIGLFKSAAEAGRVLDIPKSLISKCLNDKYYSISAYGYKFEYCLDLEYFIKNLDKYVS